ncbi:HalOD1 output domain-containing protein [Halomicroarcula sp. GCM10025817]|uniref:HalOD1 output domain-containing protein n=1 Tax=Haloarcula TaxID=2237 RepID=UPI0023E77146|nr:HalOD1 output domain-containing protein [Halomicroarcula sp. SYNS111]
MEYEVGSDESVSTAVVRAVSAVDGRKPSSLPPLTRVLDPDALDALFDSHANGEPRAGGRLSFIYSRCRITLDNGEFLTIQPLKNHPRATSDRESSCIDRR